LSYRRQLGRTSSSPNSLASSWGRPSTSRDWVPGPRPNKLPRRGWYRGRTAPGRRSTGRRRRRAS